MKSAMKNLHVPLTRELYKKLRTEAEISRKPATEIAREAIESWLLKKKKEAINNAILEYASQNAGSYEDLDEDIECSSSEFILNDNVK